MQLLFCDTFSNIPATPNGGWAVIKFPGMIGVDEIWVLPPHAKVHTKLQDPRFIGHTNPNNFHVDFYSDNRSASSTTYERVGALEYSTLSHNRFHPSSALFTEKLLLNGWFTSITVAVYGTVLSSSGMDSKNRSLGIVIKSEGRRVYEQTLLPPVESQMQSEINQQIAEYRSSTSYIPDSTKPRRHYGGHHSDNFDRSKNYPDHQPHSSIGENAASSTDHNITPVLKDVREQVSVKHRTINGRKTLLPDPDQAPILPIGSAEYNFSHNRDFNKQSYQRGDNHYRHETIDPAELTRHRDEYKFENKDPRRNRDENKSDDFDNENRGFYDNQDNAKDEGQWNTATEYEEISEEDIHYEENTAEMHEMQLMEDDLIFPASMMQFNPFLIELLPLEHFSPPDISKFEEEISKLINQVPSDNLSDNGDIDAKSKSMEDKDEKSPPKIPEIMKSMENFVNVEINDTTIERRSLEESASIEFLNCVEEILPLLNKELPEMIINENEVLAHELCGWALIAIDSNNTMKQTIGVNIRILKAGLNLAMKLCQTFLDIVNILSENRLADMLLELLRTEHMASSIKVLVVHCLNSLLDWPIAMDKFLGKTKDEDDSSLESDSALRYGILMELLLSPQAARVSAALSKIVQKINFYESLNQFRNTVLSVYRYEIPKIEDDFLHDEGESSEDDNDAIIDDNEMMVMSQTNDSDVNKTTESESEDLVIKRDNETRNISSEESVRKQDEALNVKQNPEEDDGFDKNDDEECNSDIEEADQHEEDTRLPMSAVIPEDAVTLTQETVNEIVMFLNSVTEMLKTNGENITQPPLKSFPTRMKTCDVSYDDTIKTIFRMLEHFNILASVQMLITMPVISSNNEVFEAVYLFLDFLTSIQPGLLHLAFNFKTTVCIFRHLLCSAATFSKLEIETPGTAAHLGAKISLHLQCIQCLDQLNSILVQDSSNEDDLVDILKMIYSLSYTTFGKYWISSVFNLGENILALVTCLQLNKDEPSEAKLDEEVKDTGEKNVEKDDENEEIKESENVLEDDQKSPRKCAIQGYAAQILLNIVKMSLNVEYLKNHGEAIVQTCSHLDKVPAVETILQWINPSECRITTESTPGLVGFIKERFAKLEWSSLNTLGLSASTALKVLCNRLGIVWNSVEKLDTKNASTYESALSVFSAGGIPIFTKAITQLSQCLTYPCYSQHAITQIFSFELHTLVVHMGYLLLKVLNHLVQLLTTTTDGELSASYITNAVSKLYSDLYIILKETDIPMLENVTKLTVQIVTLTAGCKRKAEISSENEISNIKTNWGVMIHELLEFTENSCEHFVPGLILLSHCLPLPLPIIVQNEEGLDEEDENSIIASRSSVGENLKDELQRISSFLSTLLNSTCLVLMEVLIPVYQQLIDLSADVAEFLMKDIVFKLLHKKMIKKSDKDEYEKEEYRYVFRSQVAFVLSEIIQHPSAKSALLCCQDFNNKTLTRIWSPVLKSSNETKSDSIKGALALFCPLLDVEISLLDEESIISSRHFNDISTVAIEGLIQTDLFAIHSSLRCLTLLSRTESGFQSFKSKINSTIILNILELMLNEIDCDEIETCYFVLCQFVIFMNSISEVTSWDVEDNRRSSLNHKEICNLFPSDQKNQNPIFSLKDKFESIVAESEENFYDDLLDELTCFCQYLTLSRIEEEVYKEVSSFEEKEKEEVKVPSLVDQFKCRPIWMYGDYDCAEEIRQGILMGNVENSFSSLNITQQKIQFNLIENSEKYCTGFDIQESLNKLIKFADSAEIDRLRLLAKEKRKQKLETFSLRIGKTMTYMKRSHGLPNQPNPSRGRGRGRGRGSFVPGFRPYDLFRQRKQNTSRPPSMHVDDFVAADEEDEQKKFFKSPHSPVQSPYRRSSSRSYVKRDFVPRGRRGRPFQSTQSAGFHSHFSSNNQNFGDKSRFKSSPNSSFPRYNNDKYTSRIRGRGRDFGGSITFSPREGFKTSKTQQWSYTPRGSGFRTQSSNFRGNNRGGKINRGLSTRSYPPPPPPPPGRTYTPYIKRGRGGYIKPRGLKPHSRSFTR